MKQLIRRVKDLIDDNQVTQKKLAETFGITESTMSTYMTGKYRIPAWFVKEFAAYFHVTTDYLYGLTDDPSQPFPVSAAERRLLEDFRVLTRDQKELVMKSAALMREQNRR